MYKIKDILNRILCGDALEILKQIPDESINCVITSPPYWSLRDYGTAKWEGGILGCNHKVGRFTTPHSIKQGSNKGSGNFQAKEICPKCGAKRIDNQVGLEKTFDEYVTKLCDIFDEAKRALKKDGTCWVNIGDTFAGSLCGYGAKNDSKTGFQKAPINAGFYGSSKQKPPSAKAIYHEIKRYGGRGKTKEVPAKSLCLIPFRFVIEMINRGWILRNTIIWHKSNCMPASVKDRFTVDFEYIFFFVKNKKYWFEQQFEKYQNSTLKRVKYGCKSKKTDTGIYGGMNLERQLKAFDKIKFGQIPGRNKRCVWTINTKPSGQKNHYASYPETLCVIPIKAGCPEGGIVLDPFCGTGTSCVVTKKLNRNYIGIDLSPEYVEISKKRIETECGNLL